MGWEERRGRAYLVVDVYDCIVAGSGHRGGCLLSAGRMWIEMTSPSMMIWLELGNTLAAVNRLEVKWYD